MLRHDRGKVSVFRLYAQQVTRSQTLIPVPIPRKRSRSSKALALLLVFLVLVALYYMVFVITVPCGAGLNGHWTIWQMISHRTCNYP